MTTDSVSFPVYDQQTHIQRGKVLWYTDDGEERFVALKGSDDNYKWAGTWGNLADACAAIEMEG